MNRTTGPGEGHPGWLIVRTDATILAADEAACVLLGAPSAAGLTGRTWTSLVAHGDGAVLGEVITALAAGHTWRGLLRFLYGVEPTPLLVEVVPTEPTAGVALLRLEQPPAPPPQAPAAAAPASILDEDARTRLAALDALEALNALADPSAAARAVLQALRGAVAHDWAAVLRFVDGTPPGAAVLAVYPAPMAGVGPGAAWSPLDPAEAGVLRSGEPELSADLGRDPAERSPLARLTAFGMRSRLHLPLFAAGRVVGDLVVYAATPHALGIAEGVRLERIVRPLGERLAQHPVSQPSVASPPPAAVQAALPFEPPLPPPSPPSQREGPVVRESDRLSALGELVSGVAHELNNPLTSILGYAQIINTLEGADRDNAVSTIEQEALRASRIVRNLLSFARQEPRQSTTVDLEDVLRRVIELRRYSLEVDNVTVVTRFGGVPSVIADEAQFEQVFLNLLNNAQQALRPAGGQITIATAVTDGHVRISVMDNGPGVPEDVRGRIFEPFFTTHEAGSGGQGMGLSTVYGVVTEHGGRVWVEPSSSGGAQFVIELPLRSGAEAAAPIAPPVPATPSPGGGTERILVVDDEAPIRALISEILGAAGYRVVSVATGDEALHRLEDTRFDLIVADMLMPGADGGVLYEQVGERWPELRRRILFVTGDIEGERTNRLLTRGDIRYLEKPFDTGALLRAIRAALDERPQP